VHRFISKDNDRLVRAGLEQAVAAHRKAQAATGTAVAAAPVAAAPAEAGA
jgi:hypothetical protein